jgi:multidrug resistance efflux pump
MKFSYKSNKQTEPEKIKHLQVSYAPSKRYFPRFRWYLILLIAASPLLYFVGQVLYNEIVISAPAYVVYDKVTVRTQGNGVIAQIYVKDGDQVVAGQPLIKLDDKVLDLSIKQATEQLAMVQTLSKSNRQIIMEQLERKLRAAEDELAFANKQMAIINIAHQEGDVGLSDYTAAETFLSNAKYQFFDINIQIARENEKYATDLKTPEGYVSQEQFLQDQLNQLKLKKMLLTISAPVNSMVLTTLVAPDEYVTSGEDLLVLATRSKPYILTYLEPKYMNHATKGTMVKIVFANGDKMKGIVMEKPKLTGKLPAELVSPIETRNISILIKIEPLDTLGNLNHLDGVPAKVYFPLF